MPSIYEDSPGGSHMRAWWFKFSLFAVFAATVTFGAFSIAVWTGSAHAIKYSTDSTYVDSLVSNGVLSSKPPTDQLVHYDREDLTRNVQGQLAFDAIIALVFAGLVIGSLGYKYTQGIPICEMGHHPSMLVVVLLLFGSAAFMARWGVEFNNQVVAASDDFTGNTVVLAVDVYMHNNATAYKVFQSQLTEYHSMAPAPYYASTLCSLAIVAAGIYIGLRYFRLLTATTLNEYDIKLA